MTSSFNLQLILTLLILYLVESKLPQIKLGDNTLILQVLPSGDVFVDVAWNSTIVLQCTAQYEVSWSYPTVSNTYDGWNKF